MKTIIAAMLASVALVSVANAQSASPSWTDVQRACGGEWRAQDKATRQGTWIEFLNACKVRKGFVSKRNGARASVTLPDVK